MPQDNPAADHNPLCAGFANKKLQKFYRRSSPVSFPCIQIAAPRRPCCRHGDKAFTASADIQAMRARAGVVPEHCASCGVAWNVEREFYVPAAVQGRLTGSLPLIPVGPSISTVAAHGIGRDAQLSFIGARRRPPRAAAMFLLFCCVRKTCAEPLEFPLATGDFNCLVPCGPNGNDDIYRRLPLRLKLCGRVWILRRIVDWCGKHRQNHNHAESRKQQQHYLPVALACYRPRADVFSGPT